MQTHPAPTLHTDLARPVCDRLARGLMLLICLAPMLWSGCKKSPTGEPTGATETTPQVPETPSPPEPAPAPPLPLLTIPYKKIDTARLFNGVQVKTTFSAEFGGTATTERQDPSSYELDLQLRVRVPKPHQSVEELQKLNPGPCTA